MEATLNENACAGPICGFPSRLKRIRSIAWASVTVPTVERGFAPIRSWSTMIAVVSPSSTSTSGRAIDGMNPCTKALYVSLISRWDSAAIVSNTSDDFPDPETPVKTEIRRFGISTETSFRLFSRAPRTLIMSWLSATQPFVSLIRASITSWLKNPRPPTLSRKQVISCPRFQRSCNPSGRWGVLHVPKEPIRIGKESRVAALACVRSLDDDLATGRRRLLQQRIDLLPGPCLPVQDRSAEPGARRIDARVLCEALPRHETQAACRRHEREVDELVTVVPVDLPPHRNVKIAGCFWRCDPKDDHRVRRLRWISPRPGVLSPRRRPLPYRAIRP